ncbi:CoA-binding protein [Desulfurispira natronophila]|uniref:CoA-binding domain-containing protein n=1 Tax=Desulfurispira natronophila TaxID=682562 RepID=A0A7W7Y2Z8_9BACT|nr:CoA-binding protein [Desulfurispira natronophila]MBB5021118.1 hypothetical protein [Desulfurispira natronophila]
MIITQSQEIKNLFNTVRTIAVVGFSVKEDRASNFVSRYLVREGYSVIPVNPAYQGEEHLGQWCIASLDDLSESVDMVLVFQRSERVPPIVTQAVAAGAAAVWMQKGIIHQEAAQDAVQAGLKVVMDRCAMVEHANLFDRQPLH